MRVLLVKTSSLGDVVQTLPVVEYLKKKVGVRSLGWVVEKKISSLVRAHPLVDTVIEIDSQLLRSTFAPSVCTDFLRQKRAIQQDSWDVVFDLQGNCKSGMVTWLARSPMKVGYGVKSVAESPNILATRRHFDPPPDLSIRDEYLYIVQRYFDDVQMFEPSSLELSLSEAQEQAFSREKSRWPTSRPIWFLAVGSRWPNKMCRTESLISLLSSIQKAFGPHFIFTAATQEELNIVGTLARSFPNESHVLFKPELSLLQRLINSADAVLAVDSLILHLAATTKTPTFSFFGPSNAAKYAPRGGRHGFLQTSCPSQTTFDKRCPLLRTCYTGLCLKGADPETMFSAVQHWQHTIKPH